IHDFGGQGAGQAAHDLQAAGFTVDTSSEYSDSVPAGSVISQSPHDGTGFKHDHIKLVSSLGPELVTVPNVKSMGVLAAKRILEDKGLQVKTSPSSLLWLGFGYVASSNPAGGTKAPKGSTITLNLV